MRQFRIIPIILAVLAIALLAGTALADAPANATPIALDTQTTVTISTGGEFQYFNFTPAESAYYAFTSCADEDQYTCALLYDAQMRTIAYNEDGTPTGNDFQLVYPLEAGKTYYYAAGFYGWDDIGAFPVRLEKQDSLLAVAADSYVETSAGRAVALRILPLSDSDLTYQWYRVTANGTTTPLAGEIHSNLILLAPTRSSDYVCRVADGDKTQDIHIQIGMENDDWLFPGCETEQHVNPGSSQPVTLSVQAAGSAGSVSYQWYRLTYDENGNLVREAISGATGDACTLGDPNPGEYYCRAVNGDGDENEIWFQLIVDNGFRISRVSDEDITIDYGESTTLAVRAQAGAGELSYQWFTFEYDESRDERVYTPISGATGATYTTGGLTEYTRFACRVTDSYGNTDEATFWIDVEASSSDFSIEPVGSDYIEIESGEEVPMSVTAKNAVGSVTYRWYRGLYDDEAARYFYARIPDATGASYTATGITRMTGFLCEAECGDDVSSVEFTVTPSDIDGLDVNCEPDQYISVEYGGSAELEVKVSGATGDVSYQWFRDDAFIPGANSAAYTCEGVYGYTSLRCRVQDDNSVRWGNFSLYVSYSDVGGLSVSPVGESSKTVKPGESATFTVNATGENLTYQWVKSEKLPYGYSRETTVIDGANQATLNTGAIDRETYYYCNVTDGTETGSVFFSIDIDSGLSVKSALKDEETTVHVEPNATTQLGVNAETDADSLSYQWYVSRIDEDEGYWYETLIPGATSASYTTPAVTEYIRYYCEVKDGYNEDTIWFYVYPDSGFSAEAVTDTELEVEPGKPFTMRVEAKTKSGTLTYQWSVSDYDSEDDYYVNTRPIDGANGNSYTVANPMANARYTCRVSDGYNSADIQFYVTINSGLTVEGDRDTHYDVELGDDVTMSVTATTKMPDGVTYQWYRAEMDPSTGEMGDYELIPGATGDSYTADDIAAQVSYHCEVSDGIRSADRYFHIYISGIELVIANDDQFLLASNGGSITLHADATTNVGSLHYQWFKNGTPISGQTGADYTLSDFSGSAIVWCRVWNDYGRSDETGRFLCASDAIVEEIEADDTATASITKGSPLALFEFVPEATAQYTLTSYSDSKDTYGYLVNASGSILYSDDDGGDGTNFQIKATLAAGQTYYWIARYYFPDRTGSFDVELTQGEAMELDTIERGALALRAGQSVVMPKNTNSNWENPSAAISGDTSILTTRGATVTAVAPGTAQLSVMYPDSGESWVYSVTVYPDEGVLRLPASLSEIENEAFKGDTSIRFVELGDGVESIGSEAFAGTGVVQIVVNSNSISIYDDFFGESSPTIVCPRNSSFEWTALDLGLNVVYLP